MSIKKLAPQWILNSAMVLGQKDYFDVTIILKIIDFK
jgi:hypothetical protein